MTRCTPGSNYQVAGQANALAEPKPLQSVHQLSTQVASSADQLAIRLGMMIDRLDGNSESPSKTGTDVPHMPIAFSLNGACSRLDHAHKMIDVLLEKLFN